MNMIELRLPRALVTVATVGLIVLIAQWLPGSANGGDPLIDTLGSVPSTLDKHGISLGLQSTNELFGNPNGGGKAPPFSGKPLWGWALILIKRSTLKVGYST
jgi:hypothetical protein